jgi:hypothetical protein
MFYQHNMGAGGWIFMVLGNIVIWGLIIAFIVWLAQDLRSRPHRHHIASGASASEILDRRLGVARSAPTNTSGCVPHWQSRLPMSRVDQETRPGLLLSR